MGNRVTLIVRPAATPGEGQRPGPVAPDDGSAATATWEIQNALPFAWTGLVPADAWAAHRQRLGAAMAAGDPPDPEVTDVVVAWPLAEAAYAGRLDALAEALPTIAGPLRDFLEDLRSVAVRTEDPVVELVLGELVEMSWDDEDLAQYGADLLRDTAPWDDPTSPRSGALTDLPAALRAAEPERSFRLTGEWTSGGAPAPRAQPPALPLG